MNSGEIRQSLQEHGTYRLRPFQRLLGSIVGAACLWGVGLFVARLCLPGG